MRESQIELAPDRLVRIDPETYRALAYPNCEVLAVKERISMSCPELSSYGANKLEHAYGAIQDVPPYNPM